jgi:hypothetical protein
MKKELKKLSYVPKNRADLSKEFQKLWDQVDPRDFRHYIEQLICKLEDVIEVCGIAIVN